MNLTPIEIAALKTEVEVIEKAIEEAGGNKSEAAKILQIDRKTIYNKINRLRAWQRAQRKGKSPTKAKAPQ